MKKTFMYLRTYLLLFAIACAILILFPSQVRSPQPRMLTVTLNLQEWEAVMEIIDKSNAGHLQVKAIQDLLLPQLRRQINDTSTIAKPKQRDSIPKKH